MVVRMSRRAPPAATVGGASFDYRLVVTIREAGSGSGQSHAER